MLDVDKQHLIQTRAEYMQLFESGIRNVITFQLLQNQKTTVDLAKSISFPVLHLVLSTVVVWSSSGCNPEATAPTLSNDGPMKSESSIRPRKVFTDVTTAVGLSFVHRAGDVQSYEFPRSMGSGCAWLDANGDHRLDMLLVNGGEEIDIGNTGQMASLYLQNPDGQFIDFSEESGLTGTGYGMGVTVGDIENDGDVDIYLTKYGTAQLFLNDGAGHFRDVTQESGIVNPQWSTAAAFTDMNHDGWLDLVIANYVDYFPGTFCADAGGRQDFCGPKDFHGTSNRLFLNLGSSDDGKVRFEDHSAASGIAAEPGKSLGIVCRDFNNDGETDVFFANDGEPNQLWIQRNGMFTNEAVIRGAAVNRFGEFEANMGTVVGDFCGDAEPDLLVTHLSGEMNTLWQGDAKGNFRDRTSEFQFGPDGLAFTGFGIVATDLDCDGGLDLIVANGKVKRDRHRMHATHGFWADYAERNQIFLRVKNDFRELNDGTAGFCGPEEVSRGLATGDFDRDGDLDLLVTNAGGMARLYRNDAEKTGHWLTVALQDSKRQRTVLGARVTVIADAWKYSAEILTHTSYLSSHEPTVHFGLGAVSILTSVEVVWPDEPLMVEVFAAPATDQRVDLIRGSGIERRAAKVEEVP